MTDAAVAHRRRRRLLQYGALIALVVALPFVLATLTYDSLRAEGFDRITWLQLLAQGMVRWYVWLIVVPVMQRRARRMDPAQPWHVRPAGHAKVYLAFAPAHTV